MCLMPMVAAALPKQERVSTFENACFGTNKCSPLGELMGGATQTGSLLLTSLESTAQHANSFCSIAGCARRVRIRCLAG